MLPTPPIALKVFVKLFSCGIVNFVKSVVSFDFILRALSKNLFLYVQK